MRATGILHPDLVSLLASAGHGDRIVLADAGLRIPEDRRSVDLAVTCGVPRMSQILDAVQGELVVESAVVAEEFEEWNPDVHRVVVDLLVVEPTVEPHQDLMAEMAKSAYAYVKTGECTAYSSVVLVCGVSYLDDAIDLYTEIHGHGPE
jgi:D-ribose pyranase